ncbi:MAG TPA: prolyl oligopeptidase family serine peptidase [Blastocatellia bacterium]|nr:prolyl oligopeptidase family serine peptidase [Blastocatellia bacterium]HMX24484.1 prolyl oligopeptidase family serine peptidase [Blastocatellia bacterium]HMZ22043.1 prolyl oligopeptidase family serine peptidase [Blastocatellia bacterium]HNG30056.1 prolyl oligopeptidase family serine peptidase [Blastocatellia bacterium]
MTKKSRIVLIALMLALSAASSLPFKASGQAAQQAVAQRPIELADSLAWKRVASPTISADGQWFAHKVTPNEGDSEVILRRLSDGKEWRFPVGESQGFAAPPGIFLAGGFSADIAFSDDSKWFAFTISPTFKEGKRLKKERKPLQNKVAVINLATEKKVEFEKIKRFSFSAENAAWIALHRYGADAPGGVPAGMTPPAGGGSTPAPERATGSDLILYELATGNQLNVGNVADFSFNKKGDWLAWTIDANEKTGNGVQARNMTTGAVLPLDSDKAGYRGLNWTEKGDALAAVKGVEDKGYEDKLYSVVGFTGFANGAPVKTVYDPREDKSFPAGLTVSPNRNPSWTEDFSALLFGVHEVKKKKGGKMPEKPADAEAKPDTAAMAMRRPQEDEAEKPDLVLWHWKDGRLQSQQQVEEPRDKNFSYLCTYRVADKKFVRLADEQVRNVTAAPKQKFGIGFDNSPYELLGNLDGRRYQDIYVVDLKTGVKTPVVRKNRWNFGPSPDGTHFLYYDDGHFFTYDVAAGKSYKITEKVPSVFWDQEDDHNVSKPPTNVIGWTKDGASVLLTDDWDIWNVPVHGGNAVNLTANGKKDKIRYQARYRIDPEEKGIDLSQPVYLRVYGEWTKKAGIGRIDGGKPGVKMLQWDDAGFGGVMKAKKADVWLYTRETHQDAPSYYVADASLAGGKKITDANPQQKNFLWSSGVKLIDYTSAKGDKLQGALFLPANYEPGKSYPTIVYIYEKLSQGLNNYTMPTYNGFNKSVYTSNGYAVLMPDIVYKVNDPGMSAVWCVLPALEAAIKTGVVDKARVGIQGHSWGGYQTSFLVTQTDAFAAAVAGAPLTEMITMYNSIYWNSGGGNMAIFESSQGRFTGSPLDVPEAYQRNSPITHAKNVKTPLVILHNDKDGAVDFTQGIFYYNTLRRLQKPVVMLQYKGENHGLRVPANMKDYTVRMKEFFDHHLKGKPAPKWWLEGVPLLKLKDHLEEVSPEKPKPIDPLNEDGTR